MSLISPLHGCKLPPLKYNVATKVARSAPDITRLSSDNVEFYSDLIIEIFNQLNVHAQFPLMPVN